MSLQSRIALLAAAAAFWPAASALAADYDPPIFVEEAPEVVPVEVGSGWYLRGDIAYSTNADSRNVDFGLTPVTYTNKEDPIFGSIGFGYHFNDYLRADINLGYLPGNKESASYSDGTILANGSLANHAWTGMANGYIDLGTYVGITPYVGAGAGVYQTNWELNARYVDPTTNVTFRDQETEYSFAYTLNAGFAYQVSKNLAIDVGYQYLSAPNAKYAVVQDLQTYPTAEGLDYHQFKVGLRYDLW